MQPEVHAQVMELLQAATTERDLAERLRLLRQTQDLLLRADTLVETVAGCLDYFLNLQADPHASLRRYAAHFLERVLFFKPSLALRCTAAVAALLADSDGLVRELALKAAIKLHGRALFLLGLEHEASQFQRQREQLQRVEAAVRGFLVGGCPDRPEQFQLATRWAKVAVLAQTPSPLPVRIRVPSELRGVTCLEDFPDRLSHHLDLNALRQQAEELFKLLCNLVQHPPQGRWGRGHFQPLLQCVGAVARQRPPMLPALLEEWAPLLRAATAVAETPSLQAPLPVAVADAAELRQCLWAEVQSLLASGLTVEHRADLVELLHGASITGYLEDLATQAKYQQALAAAERAAAEETAEPRAKRPRRSAPRRAWVGIGPDAAEDESAFDTDALLSGETEAVCRHFEDYFGLPSQREPAGHVSGPALLASRVGNDAELARIALTSLNSLSLKRSLLRDRAHERVVAFGDTGPPREADGRTKGGAKAGADSPDLAIFLAADPANVDRAGGRDPRRSLLPTPRPLVATQPKGKLQAEDDRQLVPLEAANVRLPSELAARDGLQLRIFDEVLEAQRRMDKSALRDALSEEQLQAFERLTRQVALHLLTALKTPLSPSLQRRMCQVYLLDAFDRAKAALDSGKAAAGEKEKGAGPGTGAASAMCRLVELFYAKFTADVSRWQEASQQAGKAAAEAAAKTPLRDILEGARGFAKPQVVFTYAELFQMFIEEFRRRELPRRELRAFLNEIPVVPLSAFAMLEAQCQQSASRKMALLTVLSLVEGKPACRWQCLHLLFKLAYSGGQDSSVRFDTIRLIINKIYRSGPQPPMRWQLPHLTDAEAAPLIEGGEAEEAAAGWELPDDDFVPLQRLRGRCVEDIATLMLRSMAPNSAKFTFLVNAPLRVEQLRADLFKGVLCCPKDRVWLYLALCIKRPVLLHELVETFTKCDSEMKEHLINSIEEAIKYIPASEKELLVVVQKATPETESLVRKVLNILMQTSQGKEGLSPAYGEAVTRFYGVTKDPRLLVPVFDLLERRHLLDFLPAILQLDAEQVTDAFRQLIRSRAPPLSVSELLTELHHMNTPTENIVPIKCSMQALNIIFGMRDQFDPKVYGIVIQALVEEPGPLPTLFMRTVIQVVKQLPRLQDFVVVQILPRLVRQEVWGDNPLLWKGLLIVLQHTFPSQSGGVLHVLAMLPTAQLEDVLVQYPKWKEQMREYVARQPVGVMPPHVRQLLQ